MADLCSRLRPALGNGQADPSIYRFAIMMPSKRRRISYPLAVTFLLLGATLVASKATSHRNPQPLAQSLATIPLEIDGFAGTENPPVEESVLRTLNPTGYLSRSYRKAGLTADL